MTVEQIERAKDIIKYSEGEVMQTPHLLLALLKLYSDIFLGGKSPGTCERCARNYYYKLKSMNMKPTTCKLQDNKIYHVRIGSAIVTYTNHNITDEAATRMLINKQLQESDFVKLPDNYNSDIEPVEAKPKKVKQAKS